MKFLSSLIVCLPILSACSLYQSDGRKFLEKRAFEYSGASAQANLMDCREGHSTETRQPLYSTEQASAFRLDDTPFGLRVAVDGDRPYVCDYGFTNEEELVRKIPDAVELTIRTPPWTR